MSKLFREWDDKCNNEPESLTPEEKLERAEFELQVAQDNHFEAVQELLDGSSTGIILKELKKRE